MMMNGLTVQKPPTTDARRRLTKSLMNDVPSAPCPLAPGAWILLSAAFSYLQQKISKRQRH